MRPPCWWWLVQMPAYNTSRPPSLLALPCVAAWLACWCRWRFVPCWPFCGAFRALSVCWWYKYTSRARCAQYTPVSVPYANSLYKHQPRQCWRRPCWPCVAASRAGGACAGLGGRARPGHHTAAGCYLRTAGVARCPHLYPALPISRRFGGFSALRWCPMLARCPCARFAGVGVLVR